MKTYLIFLLFLSFIAQANDPGPCTPSSGPDMISSAQQHLNAISRAIQCEDLKPGESFIVDTLHDKDRSPTRIPSGYSIERVSDKKFISRINMNFIADPAVKTTPSQMMDIVRGCIQGISPFFRGPNGEVIDVQILSQQEAAALPAGVRPPEVPVKLIKAGIRAENIGYPEDIDCKTIGHEVLHLMGLVDEYSTTGDDGTSYPGNYFDENGNVVKGYDRNTGMANGKLIEPKPKWIYAYNCRVVAGRPSMMKIAKEIFADVVPTTSECECETDDCRRLLNSSQKVRSLYLSNSALIMPDSDYRMNYCKSTSLPVSDLKKFEEKGDLLKVNQISANTVDYEYSSFSDPNYSQVKRTKIQCTCEGSDECQKGLTQIKAILEAKSVPQQLFCPKGSRQVSKKYGAVDVANPYAVKVSPEGTFTFNTITKAFYAGESLLQPNHFERIVGGLCGEKASGYNRCAQFFLKTDALGKCDQVPKECKDSDYFLGRKKGVQQ